MNANAVISNSASATLTINPVDDAPVANNITPLSFNENTQSIITLSYTDVDSDLATVCAISGLSNVTVTQACACAAGTCTVGVTGTLNYYGAASFNYTVTANAVVSNSAAATLTINNVDNAPVANNITPAAFNEDIQSIITLSYTDADSDLATVCALSGLTNVSVTQACACATGTCTVGVTGTLNYNGAASFNYTVTANAVVSNSASATLTINPVDDAPVANNITPPSFNENTQSIITLSYTDVDSDLATVCAISGPSNVTVTQACACAAGTCTVGVTGTLNYNGAASFGYTVTANAVVSNSASATLTIVNVDDAPVANNITPPNFNKNAQSIITLSYTDVDSDLASVCAISSATNVTVTQACACAAGTCTVGVTGTFNYFGAASFNYTVTANAVVSNSASATLTIVNVDNAPVANNITPAAFNEDIQRIITLSYTDSDSDLATACALSGLSNVTVTQTCACTTGTCTVGVTGALNYNGAASFTYTVSSNSVNSNVATATLTINPVNDAPTISAIGVQTGGVNAPTGPIAFTINDIDSTLTCSAARLTMTSSNTALVANGSVAWSGTAPNCTAIITPVANKVGTTSITLSVNDGAGGTATSVFTLNINGVILIWTNNVGATITSYDFGTPGANTSATVNIKNIGNVTSSAVSVVDNGGDNKISQSNSCTTIAMGVSCPVTVLWDNNGSGGPRTETFTASADGSAPILNVTGTK